MMIDGMHDGAFSVRFDTVAYGMGFGLAGGYVRTWRITLFIKRHDRRNNDLLWVFLWAFV